MSPPRPSPLRQALHRLHAWRWQLGTALALLCGIALLGLYLYRDARHTTEAHLTVIAELKASEIERWLGDKRGSIIQPVDGFLARSYQRWQQHSPEQRDNLQLRERLAFYKQRHNEVRRVDLYDAAGRFVLGSETAAPTLLQLPDPSPTPDGLARLIDFYPNPAGAPRLAFSAPLYLRGEAGEQLVGFVTLVIDPQRYLFPYLQTWPDLSHSGESLLVRASGDAVSFLSPRRSATPGQLQLSRESLKLPAGELPAGQSMLVHGRDYRGVSVLRAVRPIAGSPWILLAKIDAREAYAHAWRNLLIFTVFLVLLAVSLFRLLQYKQRRSIEEAERLQQTRDMQLLRTFIDAVPETLHMVRRDGTVKLINRTGAERLGSTPEELVGSNIFERLPPQVRPRRQAAVEEACGRPAHEPVVLNDSRNGIEYLSMLYPLGDGEHAVIIATDVTRRNADARALHEAANTLQRFIDHLPGTAYVKNCESRMLVASQGFKSLLGIEPAGMIGKLSNEIFDGEFGAKIVADDLRVLASGRTQIIEESFNGRFYESTKFIIPREDGPPDLGGITLDVSARHQAEQALRQSEDRLRRLGDNLPDSVLYQTAQMPDGSRRFLYVSSGVERLLGLSPTELLDDMQAFYARLDPAGLPLLEAGLHSPSGDLDITLRIRRPHSQWGWVNLHARRSPEPDEQGRIIWNGVATDVTARHLAEEALALQARRATALLALPEQAEQLDEKSFMVHAQEVAEKLTGSQIAFMHFVDDDQEHIELTAWSRNTLTHYCKAVFEHHYPLSQAGVWADSARQHAPVIINDYPSHPGKHGLPEGHSRLQRLISVPVMEAGKVKMMAGVGNKASDYSETDVESVQLIANEVWRILRKRRAEKALEQTRQVVEASPVVCFRWRPEEGWPVAYVSDNVRRWGYSPEQLLEGGLAFSALIHPEDLPRIGAEVSDYLARGINEYTQEYRLLRPDGSAFWITDATVIQRDEAGQVSWIDGLLTDISERKAQEAHLAASLASTRALNARLEEAHNQLLQAEKLAAIGQLAAGVAHELNNPIGFVYSNLGTLSEYVSALVNLCDTYARLLDERHPECPELVEIQRIKQDQDYAYLRSDIFPLLEDSRDGLVRVRKIVQDLRDFSRTGDQEWAPADLLKGLESTLNIVANELKYKCSVRKEYTPLPDVECVLSQINQVFMNLLVNAAQAIESQGEITLRSGLIDEDQVWVSITDTGKGIPPEHLNRIFEPFFTTKPVGIGTGLGLSLAFGIVNRHHGRIEVDSQPGQGTTFRIVLPIRQARGDESPSPEVEAT